MALRRGESKTDDRSDERRDPEVVHDYPGTGVTPLMIALSIISVLLIVFLAQNTDSVPVEFLVWEGEAPLFVVVLVALAAAAFTTLGVSGIWRRRRRQHRTEREELERLRRTRTA